MKRAEGRKSVRIGPPGGFLVDSEDESGPAPKEWLPPAPTVKFPRLSTTTLPPTPAPPVQPPPAQVPPPPQGTYIGMLQNWEPIDNVPSRDGFQTFRIGPQQSSEPGWNQDSSGNDDELITQHLTPCDPLNTSNQEEVRTAQVEETRNMVLEQISTTEGQETIMEGQVEETIMEGQVEQMSTTEEQVEQMSTTVEQETIMVEQVEQLTIMEGKEKLSTTVEQVEQETTTEGQMEQMNTMEGQDCSYHTRLEAFPIRSVVREREDEKG
ncbi:hypothetical protein QQF64_033850 [Cirrhinus molitorella]|uniref:Uncharacterized protein n=1 Tax=Cirrhinus molitorella TaxID=172907 RepID=A0ABR3MV33_9TELE